MKFFEKSELKYLGLAYAFILALILIINVQGVYEAFDELNPVILFFLINGSIYAFLFMFAKSLALGKSVAWKGALGGIFGYMAIALVSPEYHVTSDGLVAGGIFGRGTVDYFFGYLISSFTSLNSGIWFPIVTYFVSFTILFGAFALLIKNAVGRIN